MTTFYFPQNDTRVGIVFRRQNLTSKFDPLHTITTDNIGIQMKRKELTKKFMIISKRKITLWYPWFIEKYVIASELIKG